MSTFAWQSNKAMLFYFTKTLSPRFNSVPVYRGQVLSITLAQSLSLSGTISPSVTIESSTLTS